jgi:NCAIR mutase (PurE)-related protein
MDPRSLKELLEKVKSGAVSPEEAASRLATLPYEDLGFAKVDHHRALRRGFPETVFGAGKTPEQVAAIVDRIAARGQRVLVTRTTAEVHQKVASTRPEARFHPEARCLTVETTPAPALPGRIAVCAAGTSDLPVAEEAAVTAVFHGATVERIYDVGVAGLHRLLDRAETIRKADVVVVVAGMGAFPGRRWPRGRARRGIHGVGYRASFHSCRPPRDAELLRLRRGGRQHRQRFRGGSPRVSDLARTGPTSLTKPLILLIL